MLDLRLLLRRRDMLAADCDERCSTLCGEIACSLVQYVHAASYEVSWSLSPYLKTHAPTVLFSPIIALATLLIRNSTPSDLLDMCRLRFKQATEVISRLSPYLPAAAHVESQLSEIVRLTNDSLKVCDSRPPGVGLLHDAATMLDFGDLFTSEIHHLLSNSGGLPEVRPGAMVGDSVPTNSTVEGGGEEFAWDALFASFGTDTLF